MMMKMKLAATLLAGMMMLHVTEAVKTDPANRRSSSWRYVPESLKMGFMKESNSETGPPNAPGKRAETSPQRKGTCGSVQVATSSLKKGEEQGTTDGRWRRPEIFTPSPPPKPVSAPTRVISKTPKQAADAERFDHVHPRRWRASHVLAWAKSNAQWEGPIWDFFTKECGSNGYFGKADTHGSTRNGPKGAGVKLLNIKTMDQRSGRCGKILGNLRVPRTGGRNKKTYNRWPVTMEQNLRRDVIRQIQVLRTLHYCSGTWSWNSKRRLLSLTRTQQKRERTSEHDLLRMVLNR